MALTQEEKDAAKAAKQAEKDAAKAAPSTPEFVVADPEILRPKELPLVITLPEGQSWKNKEQEDYAKTLNAAAYCNTENWARVKDVELGRLAEIGKDPSKYYLYTGTQQGQPGNVSFNNKLIS